MYRLRHSAWLVILVVDAAFIAWGVMAALFPEWLPGPRSVPILTAGYESFTGHSWSMLARTDPMAAAFVTVLFRAYGAYNVAFGSLAVAVAAGPFRGAEPWAWWALVIGNTIAFGAAMTYDRYVGAIGPFEISEYVGLAAVYMALAFTARRPAADRVAVAT